MFLKPMYMSLFTDSNHLHVAPAEVLLELIRILVDDGFILASGAKLPAAHMRLESRRLTELDSRRVLPRVLDVCLKVRHDEQISEANGEKEKTNEENTGRTRQVNSSDSEQARRTKWGCNGQTKQFSVCATGTSAGTNWLESELVDRP